MRRARASERALQKESAKTLPRRGVRRHVPTMKTVVDAIYSILMRHTSGVINSR